MFKPPKTNSKIRTMMYKFYTKTDKSKDAISKCNAESLDDAYNYFSAIKQMDLDKFKQIFSVEKI